MKRALSTVSFLAFATLLNVTAYSQSAPEGKSLERPNAEVEERMKKRAEFARMWFNGGVYQSSQKSKAVDFDDPVKRIKLQNYYIGMVATVYANASQKEVLVSKRVSQKKISFLIENVSRTEALEALKHKLQEAGVTVVDLGSKSVAFVKQDI